MSSGKVILGVLAGAAAGAILGLLFAPDKGSETRKKVYKKSEKYAEDLKHKFGDFIENVIKHDHLQKEEMADMGDSRRSESM